MKKRLKTDRTLLIKLKDKQNGIHHFLTKQNDQLKEPMFFGQNVNVARYDQQNTRLLRS